MFEKQQTALGHQKIGHITKRHTQISFDNTFAACNWMLLVFWSKHGERLSSFFSETFSKVQFNMHGREITRLSIFWGGGWGQKKAKCCSLFPKNFRGHSTFQIDGFEYRLNAAHFPGVLLEVTLRSNTWGETPKEGEDAKMLPMFPKELLEVIRLSKWGTCISWQFLSLLEPSIWESQTTSKTFSKKNSQHFVFFKKNGQHFVFFWTHQLRKSSDLKQFFRKNGHFVILRTHQLGKSSDLKQCFRKNGQHFVSLKPSIWKVTWLPNSARKNGQRFAFFWTQTGKLSDLKKFFSKMGSVSPCFEHESWKVEWPEKALREKTAAFRLLLNLNWGRRVTIDCSSEKMGSISPFCETRISTSNQSKKFVR